ncbi:TetR/AcrR family transcriptional regulator [Peribacillus butanolivorans]|uniref:TetR/AcrR family transcriptional regulator n=1 Tax=Peribacillus butanolivorans TaxID=421767 RepID=UPI002E1C42BC|nr:TetR/AcrR family transcriptional regulator [Peribacillus butanolivorans]
MEITKVDSRVLRTRRLLIASFITVAQVKEFKEITIKEITDEATVNRAKFYAHFIDKYDLLDAVISEKIVKSIQEKLNSHDTLSEDTIIKIFLAVTNFQTELSTQCRKSYESISAIIEQKIKKELETVFYALLLKRNLPMEKEALRIGAVMLSWGIYGASVDWQDNSSISAEQYIKIAMPYLLNGMAAH